MEWRALEIDDAPTNPQRVTPMKTSSGCSVQRVGAILTTVVIAFVASTAAAQSLDEVIAKSIKAQGGREALLGLKALERKGTVNVDGSFGQMEGTVDEVIIPWKKARRALDLAVFVQKDGWNGKTAWREGMMGLQEIEGEEAAQIKQAVDLNPLLMIGQRGTKAEKLADETVDEVAYFVIQLTPKTGPVVKLFVEKESGLIKRTTLTQNNPQFGEVEIVAEASGYESFGPVKLPTKNTIQLGEVMKIETTFTETKVNGEVDEAVFEMPKEAAK
jgi:hypothetical protein